MRINKATENDIDALVELRLAYLKEDFGTISEQDIQISGVYVDNPLIGALPSPIEIKNELDNLLSAM